MRYLSLVFALALPVAAQPAETRSVPTATLAGVVTDAETGLPVMGAGVVIPALGIGAVSQRDGSYEIAGVPPGTHAIRTGAFRYHLVTVEAEIVDAAGRLDIALRPGAGVGCEVVHEHGADGSHMAPAEEGR